MRTLSEGPIIDTDAGGTSKEPIQKIMTAKEELVLLHVRMKKLLEEFSRGALTPAQKNLVTEVLHDSEKFQDLLDKISQRRSKKVARQTLPTFDSTTKKSKIKLPWPFN